MVKQVSETFALKRRKNFRGKVVSHFEIVNHTNLRDCTLCKTAKMYDNGKNN